MFLSIIRWRRPVAIAGLVVASSIPTVAQDALQNAVREDSAYEARQTAANTQPGGWKLGPVRVASVASFNIEFNDNINNSEHKDGDMMVRPEIHFNGVWPVTDRSRLTFGIGFGYIKYLEHSELSRGYVSPNALEELAFDFSVKDFFVSVYDRFAYSQEVAGDASVSGVATLPRLDNTIGTRVTWRPGQGFLSLGYAHQNVISTDKANSYVDRASEQVFFRGGYQFNPEITAGLEAGGALSDYADEAQRDNVNVNLGPYLEWKPVDWLIMNVRGGYVYYQFSGTNSLDDPRPLGSYYVGMGVTHQITAHVSHTLSANHGINVSLNQGSDYTESSDMNYSVSWALRKNTSVSGNVSYTIGTQPGAGQFGRTENYQSFNFGPSIRQQFTSKFSGTIGYYFTLRESNLAGRSYDNNRLVLTASYAF